MALDDLQRIIEKLRKTIEAHRRYLAKNETRTRQVLIDPLLRKLGWDVSNPNIVQLEYRMKQRRPDYALMSKGKPLAVVEAKRLGSDLGDDQIIQALAYAVAGGIPYMIVTDGDKWEMYEVFKQTELEEKLLMKLELSQQPADKNASQAWTMRKPNLTAKKPVFEPPKPAPKPSEPPVQPAPDGPPEYSSNWCSFERKLPPQDTKPIKLKIGDRPEETVTSWPNAIHKVVAWLADEEILSVNHCPIGTKTYTFIGREAVNPNGTPFENLQQLPNGLILNRGGPGTRTQWRKLRELLRQFDVNSSTIQVSYRSSRQVNR